MGVRHALMFQIPLSSAQDAPVQKLPRMIRTMEGPFAPGYPKTTFQRHVVTRCECCTWVVWPQFSSCELPCPRGGKWTETHSWHLCDWCGAMRCDPVPVMRKTTAVQQCVCDFQNGERGWWAAQADAVARAPRQLTVQEYLALPPTTQ